MGWMILLWAMAGVIVAIIANSKGRNPIGWFIYGALIWPVALTHILVSERVLTRGAASGSALASPPASTGNTALDNFLADTRPCPHCAEQIKKAAKVCRFCSRDVAPDTPPMRFDD